MIPRVPETYTNADWPRKVALTVNRIIGELAAGGGGTALELDGGDAGGSDGSISIDGGGA
jgi:hypothetical protein